MCKTTTYVYSPCLVLSWLDKNLDVILLISDPPEVVKVQCCVAVHGSMDPYCKQWRRQWVGWTLTPPQGRVQWSNPRCGNLNFYLKNEKISLHQKKNPTSNQGKKNQPPFTSGYFMRKRLYTLWNGHWSIERRLVWKGTAFDWKRLARTRHKQLSFHHERRRRLLASAFPLFQINSVCTL